MTLSLRQESFLLKRDQRLIILLAPAVQAALDDPLSQVGQFIRVILPQDFLEEAIEDICTDIIRLRPDFGLGVHGAEPPGRLAAFLALGPGYRQ